MKYLAITQKTANWLLGNSAYLNSFQKELANIIGTKGLSDGVLAIGSLRITGYENQIIGVWNNDYLTGTDYEDWGFIKLQGALSLSNEPEITDEVLERELYIINQRLQGLLLPEALIHRSIGDSYHTCLAGRGEKARKYSVGYYEASVSLTKGTIRSIVTIGPSNHQGFEVIKQQLTEAEPLLRNLTETANSLLTRIKSRPILDLPYFKGIEDRFSPLSVSKDVHPSDIEALPPLGEDIKSKADWKYITADWTYEDWVVTDSPLSSSQRYILESDIITKQPLRIMGAAGTGKSLLMQLLTLRRLKAARQGSEPLSILYIVHNSEMANSVWKRFEILGGEAFILEENPSEQRLVIRTLFEHCWKELQLVPESIIDKDASATKSFQREIVEECLGQVFDRLGNKVQESEIFSKCTGNNKILSVLVDLVCSEIGVAIKGRDLMANKKKYVDSERPLTRFHGILNTHEREIVYSIFELYHKKVFEDLELLDSDDVAISLLSNLKTPLWELKRKKLGYDFVFVDETQLFNQNERQLFRLLPKGSTEHMPIVLALDEAQELKGTSTAGFGLLGIEDIANELLPNVHRCTPDILKLAFFIIQRTTDLFSSDFPDFTSTTKSLVENQHPLAKKPSIVTRKDSSSFAKTIRKEIRDLRKNNIRQVAVVVHSEIYWNDIKNDLEAEGLPLLVNVKRGELVDPNKPLVFLTRPEYIGGQEFGAVISVGLEHGIVPPMINGHAGLSEALEQQLLRELYLVFTRARYRLLIVNSKSSTPSAIIQQAINANLIETDYS